MEPNQDLVRIITERVIQELRKQSAAANSVDSKEIVIGVSPGFQTAVTLTLNGLNHAEVLREIAAGIEEEGLHSRIIKVYKTADVAFIGLEAARLSGSGFGVGLLSKGTAIIHQKDLAPLSNMELFPQSPLLTLAHYRRIGKNAACYAKGDKVRPMPVQNDPNIRSQYQVRAALIHNRETELVQKNAASIEWTV